MDKESLETPGLGERYRDRHKERGFDCGSCPVAKFIGAWEHTCSLLQNMESKDFHIHMANARKEVLLGVRSLVDEAIRLEDESIVRKEKAAGKGGKQEKLRHIDIE